MDEIDLLREPGRDGKAVLKGYCFKLLVRTWKGSSSKQ